MRGWIAVVGLWACGGSAPPGRAPGVIGPDGVVRAEGAAPPCIQQPDIDSTVTHATSEGSVVRFCIGRETTACYAYDLSAQRLELLAEPPAASTAIAHVETTSAELKVCTGTDCVSLAPKILSSVAQMRATTNADGSIAVVLLGDATAGKGYAEVWNVARPKKLATIRYARGLFRCGRAVMVGDTIVISAATCNAPGARGVMYSLRGRRIGNVGGKDFGTYGTAFAQVDPKTWAFLEENGNRIAIQNVARGKLLKTIDTSPLWSFDGGSDRNAIGNPGESALVRLGDGKLAVIAGAPSTGKIGIVDIADGTVELVQAPVCRAAM